MDDIRATRQPGGDRTPDGAVIPVEHRFDEHERIGSLAAYRGDLFRSRVSWGAIFAGTAIGLALMLLLSLLGMAIGFSAVDFGGDDGAFSGIPTGAAIWLAVSQLVALGVGGFVAGRLAAIPKLTSSALHGTAVWALASLLLLYTATTAIGTIVGGATSLVGSVASGAGSAAGTVIGQVGPAAMPSDATRQQIQDEAGTMLNNVLSQGEQAQASATVRSAASDIARDPASARAEISQMVDRLVGQGGIIGPEDRDQSVAVLARRTGMTQPEAEATIERWQSQLRSAGQMAGNQTQAMGVKAQKIGNNTANTLAKTAFWAFIASLVGLIAAAGCAMLGRTEDQSTMTAMETRR